MLDMAKLIGLTEPNGSSGGVLSTQSLSATQEIVAGQRPPTALHESAWDDEWIECVVSLSAGYVNESDGSPRLLTLEELPSGHGAVSGGLERVQAVHALYYENRISVEMIVPTSRRHHTGSNLADQDHWQVQQAELTRLGVPDSLFFPDRISFDTATEFSESFVRCALGTPMTGVAVISNRYHLRAPLFMRLLWMYGHTEETQRECGFGPEHTAMVRRLLDRPNQGYTTPFSEPEVASWVVETLYVNQTVFHFVSAEEVLINRDPAFKEVEAALYQNHPHLWQLAEGELRGIDQLLAGTYGLPR